MATQSPTRGYFHRVTALTATRFWINNPTLVEAESAIGAGAISCTTNPTYGAKMLRPGGDRERAEDAVREVLRGRTRQEARQAAPEIQRRIVAPLLERFLSLHRRSGGREGFVSIQGDPFAEEEVEGIVEEARLGAELSPNFIAKIPVTDAGLRAIERLMPEDIPIIATEVMSISQAVAACESYRRASRSSGSHPAFFVTHITGIFDEYLADVVEREGLEIDPDLLWAAGIAVARKQLRIMRERSYPGIMLGGGARALHHFTELVGEPAHITINWKGTAEELLAADSRVISRAGCPVPETSIDELADRLPEFRGAYELGGLAREEFKDFGPVEHFRRSFEAGWRRLLEQIEVIESGARAESVAEAGLHRDTRKKPADA